MVEAISCEVCGKANATRCAYGPFDSLCEACLHDLEVSSEMDRVVVKLLTLARRDPEAALEAWSEFYENNRHRTQGNWLRLAVARHRVDVLLLQRRWTDALLELDGFMSQVDEGTEPHRMALKMMASALDGLGRPKEAIDALCKIVLESSDLGPEEILSTLYGCARIAKSSGVDLPVNIGEIFVDAARWYGLTVGPGGESETLIESIESAHRQRLEAQDRYVKVLEGVKGKDEDTRREWLRQYAQQEPVRFFREMALKCIDGGDDHG